ncbi:hypothetical protein ACFL6X_03840 [Candidatus Latescibacterota bacterium]
MTDFRTEISDQNLAKLLRAALPPEARPGPGARAALLSHLLAACRPPVAPFPEALVVLLAAVLVLLSAASTTGLVGLGPAPWLRPELLGLCLVVLVNLAAVPCAALAIILRRRHV